jgi:alpha-beta hydrolase superfamily lysophospholipase
MNQYFINSKNGKLNILEGGEIVEPKGIIINVHGVGSHFQHVFSNLDEFSSRDNWFNKFNYKSFAFEFHGHGKSDGTECFITNIDDLLDDLDTVISHINQKIPNKKIFICAESMGGAIILKYLIKRINDRINGVILLSPLCGIDEHLHALQRANLEYFFVE